MKFWLKTQPMQISPHWRKEFFKKIFFRMNAHSVVWNHGGISQSLSISIILTDFIMIIELKTFVFYVQIVILKPILMRGRIKYPVSLKCAGSAKWLQIFGQHVRLVCWMLEEGLTYCFKTTSQMFTKRRLLWICLSFLMRDGRNKKDTEIERSHFGRRCAWFAHGGLKNHRRTFDPFLPGHNRL